MRSKVLRLRAPALWSAFHRPVSFIGSTIRDLPVPFTFRSVIARPPQRQPSTMLFFTYNAPQSTEEKDPRNKSLRVLFLRTFILYFIRSSQNWQKCQSRISVFTCCSLASNGKTKYQAKNDRQISFSARRRRQSLTRTHVCSLNGSAKARAPRLGSRNTKWPARARTVRTDSDQSASSSLTWSLGGRSPGKVETLPHLALATLRLVKLSIGRSKFACRPLRGTSSDTCYSWID